MSAGLRGVGKTVLLNRFTQIAEQEGYSVGFIEAPESGDLRVLLADVFGESSLRSSDGGPQRR